MITYSFRRKPFGKGVLLNDSQEPIGNFDVTGVFNRHLLFSKNGMEWEIGRETLFSQVRIHCAGKEVGYLTGNLWMTHFDFTIAGHHYEIKRNSIFKNSFSVFSGDRELMTSKPQIAFGLKGQIVVSEDLNEENPKNNAFGLIAVLMYLSYMHQHRKRAAS